MCRLWSLAANIITNGKSLWHIYQLHNKHMAIVSLKLHQVAPAAQVESQRGHASRVQVFFFSRVITEPHVILNMLLSFKRKSSLLLCNLF